jgi:hypothetical protein
MLMQCRSCLVAAFLTAMAGSATAESSGRSDVCFDVLAVRPEAGLVGTILVNRCNGQTWILVRDYQSPTKKKSAGTPGYRWSLVQKTLTEPTVSDLAGPAKADSKCFTFQGRRFCE